MLLFHDGSTHALLAGAPDKQDLIVTLDDATGHITSIFLTEKEGTLNITTNSWHPEWNYTISPRSKRNGNCCVMP